MAMKHKRRDTFIIIPTSIFESKDLHPNAKLLYGYINSFNTNHKRCYASNKYLAVKLGVDPRTIRNYSKALIEHGFISRKGREIEVVKLGIGEGRDNNRNSNNCKNTTVSENLDFSFVGDDIRPYMVEFANYKEQIGDPIKYQVVLEGIHKQLLSYSRDNYLDNPQITQVEYCRLIVTQAIAGQYPNLRPIPKTKLPPSYYEDKNRYLARPKRERLSNADSQKHVTSVGDSARELVNKINIPKDEKDN